MTSRTNHHSEGHDQSSNRPDPLSALALRRQDAVKRSLAGDPIATICLPGAGLLKKLVVYVEDAL
jgi:hypothetical protein